MRSAKPIICFMLLLFVLNNLYGQSFYHIRYNFQTNRDSTTYHAFLVLNEDGTGILRIRFLQNNQDIVLEADASEQPIQLAPNVTDSNHTYFVFSSPRYIVGKPANPISLPVFYFSSEANGFIQPAAALPSADANIETAKAPVFISEPVSMASLRKDFLLQFYTEDEEFFESIFKPITRGLSPAEKSMKLYLLIIANTNDKTIGQACAYDKERMLQTFADLSAYLGIRMISDSISGKTYGKKNAEAAIKKLNPGPNDIVVFYYSGHGFRKAGPNPRFPLIDLRAKPADDYVKESMSMEDIYKKIKVKRARMTLVLSDCCNTEVTQTNVMASKPLKTKAAGVNWNELNIRMLFLNKTPLSILATAADAGQKATCNNNFGGFFSWFFKTSMENSFSVLKTNPTWDEVFQSTQKQTVNKARHTYCEKPYIPENICNQSPVYRIETGR